MDPIIEGSMIMKMQGATAELEAKTPYGGPKFRAEKDALKRAKAAEAAFRASKGYPPDTFWNRMKARFSGK